MKAVVYDKYGPPEVLRIEEIERPAPKDNEVLIRVLATSVTATDCVFRRGSPFMSRLFTGLTKPKFSTLGDEFAGKIEATGKNVTLFKQGDRVFGALGGYGAWAEYICLPETGATMAKLWEDASYDEVVGCDGFLTALPFLRDTGKIQRGQEVLINGAAGMVGSAAVQIAVHFGTKVTGVCGTANVELVRSLGAERVIDYTREDFAKSGRKYDIIFDTVGKLSFSRCKRVLTPKGVFLEAAIDPSVFPGVLWSALFGSKKLKIAATGLRPPAERTKDLKLFGELMIAEKFKPVIDRRYSLEQIVEAHRYVETGHKRGNVVITVGEE